MLDGTPRFNTGLTPAVQNLDNFKNVELGQVVEVNDPQGLGRIKVSINGSVSKGGDNGIADNELAWCFPMIPKFFSSKPNIGEVVFIFSFSNTTKHSDRLYLGPIISQPQLLNNDPRTTTALAGFTFGSLAPNINIKNIPALRGVFPNEKDVSVQGRYNSDLIFKKSEVLIRAGKFIETNPTKENPYNFSFNDVSPAYLQLKANVITKEGNDNQKAENGTVANLVASKINLLTHKDGSPRFNLTNQDDLISQEELTKILKDAHPLAFGDIQIQYFRLLKNAFLNHVHNGNGAKPTDLTADGNKLAVAEFIKNSEELEKAMLSKNIKIN